MIWCRGFGEFTLFTGNYGQTSPSSVRCADGFHRRGSPLPRQFFIEILKQLFQPHGVAGLGQDCVTRGAQITVDIVTLLRRFAMHSYNTVRFCGVCHGSAARAVRQSAGQHPRRQPTHRCGGGRPRWRHPVPAYRPAGQFCGCWAGLSAPRRGSHAVGAGVVAVLNERHTAFLQYAGAYQSSGMWQGTTAQRAASNPRRVAAA